MSTRIAPAGGYRTARKWGYRHAVWDAFAARVPEPKNCNWLCLPSLEGQEVQTAIQRGFDISRAYLVDRSPAVAAVLSRRFPSARAHGLEIEEAVKRIAPRTGLHVVNLDLCGNISGLKDTLYNVGRQLACSHAWNPVGPRFWYAVTLCAGRELARDFESVRRDKTQAYALKHPALIGLSPRHAARLVIANVVLQAGYNDAWKEIHPDDDSHQGIAHFVRAGAYIGGRVPMVWGVCEFVNNAYCRGLADAAPGSPRALIRDEIWRFRGMPEYAGAEFLKRLAERRLAQVEEAKAYLRSLREQALAEFDAAAAQ